MQKENSNFKAYYKTTILIGIGFFTMGLMDPLYDNFVPVLLDKYIASDFIKGFLMAIDNILAVCLIPIVSNWSDKTVSPIGRRMPFILVTLPASAVLFSTLPYAAIKSLSLLIIAIFLFNIFKQASRGPVVALMPDIIPDEHRSEANGVINMMAGIAAIVGYVVLSKLYDLSIELPIIGNTEKKIPFILASILILTATALLFIFVKEKMRAEGEDEKKAPLLKSLKAIFASKDKSAMFILVSIFLWYFGYQGILPFLTLFQTDLLGVSKGTAGVTAGFVAIAYAAFAVPSGILAHKIGRKKSIFISLSGITIILIMLFSYFIIIRNYEGAAVSTTVSLWVLRGMLFFFGMFWASIMTNSFPMLWEMADYSNMGIYTGLYYFFFQTSAIISPVIFGITNDVFGRQSMFFFSALCMFTALFTISYVKHKEQIKEEAEK